ncbi:MAG: tRNA threonylcarbamoyladenosine dehydratase [Firmicutes bacterium]|nr:tRNA threonylcarbamoyladenosine dehydratase [Bacillota bacterium]
MSTDHHSEDMFSRTALLIGSEGVAQLAASSVLVVGLGGVGSACAEALARAGVGALTLVDGDVVTESNLNRQIVAVRPALGKHKAEAMAERVAAINPGCRVTSVVEFISAGNIPRMLESKPDYVADAIDSVPAKLDLIEACLGSRIRIVSSMGAGNKLDPTRFRVSDISKTHTCPMARAVRLGLRERGIDRGLTVVFSDEPPRSQKSRVPGSISFVPPAAGLAMAGVIVRDLALLGRSEASSLRKE